MRLNHSTSGINLRSGRYIYETQTGYDALKRHSNPAFNFRNQTPPSTASACRKHNNLAVFLEHSPSSGLGTLGVKKNQAGAARILSAQKISTVPIGAVSVDLFHPWRARWGSVSQYDWYLNVPIGIAVQVFSTV